LGPVSLFVTAFCGFC